MIHHRSKFNGTAWPNTRTWSKWYGPKHDAVAYDDNERFTLVTLFVFCLLRPATVAAIQGAIHRRPMFNSIAWFYYLLQIIKQSIMLGPHPFNSTVDQRRIHRGSAVEPRRLHSGSTVDPPHHTSTVVSKWFQLDDNTTRKLNRMKPYMMLPVTWKQTANAPS